MKAEEVLQILCEGITDIWWNEVQIGLNAYNQCIYCGEEVYYNKKPSNIIHTEKCPYVIAERLLKGLKID